MFFEWTRIDFQCAPGYERHAGLTLDPVYNQALAEALSAGAPFIEAIVIKTSGSVPAGSGARLLCNASGLRAGTVGGGRLEARVLEEAGALLSVDRPDFGAERTRFFQWSLNQDVGMTCGGSVSVFLQLFFASTWQIHIFGAGHVSQALLSVLAGLDCSIALYDSRAKWLEKASPAVLCQLCDDLPARVDSIASGSFILCITQGHQSDRPILARALKARRFPFVGAIGSRAKRIVLEKELIELDALSPEEAAKFHCPLGLPFGGNSPQEIAISIAAQLLQERDRLLHRATLK